MKKTVLALSVLGVAGWAFAQAPGGFTPPTFAGLDTDKNGSLSKAEVDAWSATIPGGGQGAQQRGNVFDRWDANKDGSVSQAEFDGRPRPQGGPGAGGGAGGGTPPAR